MSAIAHLLPHRGTALMLESADVQSESIVARGLVPAAHPLSDGTAVPAFVGLELGAQAAAALEGLTAAATGVAPALEGRLVRVRDAEFLRPGVPVNTTLTVQATRTGAAPPIARYHVEVAHAGVVIVRAEITTYRGTGSGGAR